jgi:hypothetical protein
MKMPKTEDHDEDEQVQYHNHTQDNNHAHISDIKKLWLSDIYDNLQELLDYYTEIDDRLKWIGISNILHSRRSSYQIIDDNIVNEFIDKFLEEVFYLRKKHVINEDQDEFEKLLSLNKEIIYSRMAFCFEKWCLN